MYHFTTSTPSTPNTPSTQGTPSTSSTPSTLGTASTPSIHSAMKTNNGKRNTATPDVFMEHQRISYVHPDDNSS